MAGHSKWANIKHRKARQDAKRSKVWSKCARAIIVAARNGGGDPDQNLTLRYAIDEAKAANMPKDTIEGAIKKGAGGTDEEQYEQVIYEGYGPNGVALMLDILTNNRNRTAGEIRHILERAGGNLGSGGCVAYMFQSKGEIFINKGAADEDQLIQIAVEAGADDVGDNDESWQVLCEPAAFVNVKKAVDDAGIAVESSGLTMVPSTTIPCTGDIARRVLNLLETLEDHDDVQKVHANFEIPDEEWAAITQ